MAEPNLEALAGAAYNLALGERFTAIDIAISVRGIASDLEPILEATTFRGRLEAVARVKANPERAIPGKAEVAFINVAGEREVIETDWCHPDTLALELARRAQRGIGRMATFYKGHDPSDNPLHSKGYRKLVWLTVDQESDQP